MTGTEADGNGFVTVWPCGSPQPTASNLNLQAGITSPNLVVAKFTFSGTMKGALGPLKATNKPLTIHGLDVDEFKDGKMLKGTTYSNGIELLAAVGALPKPPAAKPGAADAKKV